MSVQKIRRWKMKPLGGFSILPNLILKLIYKYTKRNPIDCKIYLRFAPNYLEKKLWILVKINSGAYSGCVQGWETKSLRKIDKRSEHTCENKKNNKKSICTTLAQLKKQPFSRILLRFQSAPKLFCGSAHVWPGCQNDGNDLNFRFPKGVLPLNKAPGAKI